ncbi:esterase 1 [Mycena vulgaris]|nr:esterase 1 [Mycena vulgaris]
MLVLFTLLLTSVARLVCVSGVTLRLGKTTVVGRDIPTLGQEFFGGIPFAKPPLGKLRLKPPVLKVSLDSASFNATAFGPACLQTGAQASEDCLTINLLRPAGTSANAKLPVVGFKFLYVYGGGFVGGSASMFNASAIVAQSMARGTPVIYVNFNYRVGPLGFPQGQEADNRGALNLGIKDQLAALEWVQLHIGTFGGNKKKVTIFGESAGAMMSSILFLNSPISRLARAAIFESGSQASPSLFTSERREVNWENFVGGVASCASKAKSGSTFVCLESATTTEILAGFVAAAAEAPNAFPWDPVIDGPGGLIPDLPSVLFKRGQFARLPFIAGTNLDEGTLFINQAINSTEEIEETTVSNASPSISATNLEMSVQRLLELYPDNPADGSPFNTGDNTFGLSSQFKRAAAILGDLHYNSLRRLWIETAASAGVKTFGYLFTQPQPNRSPALGVTHASEIPFVYGAPRNGSASDGFLSLVMIEYWVSFATSLTPNDGLGVPRPTWTQFTPKNKAVIQLNGANLTMIPDDFRAAQIAFINSDPLIWRH